MFFSTLTKLCVPVLKQITIYRTFSYINSPATFLTSINKNRLLAITTPLVNQSCGFKVKGRLKRRCKDCYFVVREERTYVICKTHPRHKQMSMKADEDKSWILTHATQSKVRPF